MISHDVEVWGTIAFVGALVLISAFSWLVQQDRRERLMELARQWGWTFSPLGDVEVEQEAGRLPLFQRGWGRRLTNAMAGTRDILPLHLFDYEFTVGTGRSARTYRQTVAACILKTSQSVPAFELRPKHLPGRLDALFGYHNIHFSTHHEFSSQYRLRGLDEAGLRRRFHLELLHALANQPGWSMEGEGEWVLCYRANHLVDPDDVEAFQHEAVQLAQLLTQG